MISLAADDHAERDKGVEPATIRRQRDRSGKLQRAWNGDRFMAVTRRLDGGAGAAEQHVVQMRVKTRLGDQDVRHVQTSSFVMQRSSTIASP